MTCNVNRDLRHFPYVWGYTGYGSMKNLFFLNEKGFALRGKSILFNTLTNRADSYSVGLAIEKK